jgi:hypothetical protein
MPLQSPIQVIDRKCQPFAFEQIVCTAASQALTASVYIPATHAVDGTAQLALISFEDTVAADLLRYRLDGTAPTAAIGNFVTNNESLVLTGLILIKQFRFLAPATGKINVTYFR